MYIFPGYITYREQDGFIYISSKLLQNEVRITDDKLIQEFYALIRNGGCSDLSTPLTNFLHDQELLQTEDEILVLLGEAKKLLQGDLLLTIMPTEGCNFRCPYCYESHIPVVMTPEIIRHIQTYIAEQIPFSQNVHISWFGGEPTLCMNIIYQISNFVQNLQQTHKFHYDANMTTNGYLLDVENFLKCYKMGINDFQITLDGWNHDKMRPHISGKGTMQTILKNLKIISSLPQDLQFEITIRHNILDGDYDFSWYDYLFELFGSDPRFSVAVVPVKDWGGNTVKTLTLSRNKEELQSTHEKYLDSIGMRRRGKEKKPFSDICYSSCPRGFVFRANGKIEKCSIAIDNPKNLVGMIDSQKGVVLDQSACQKWCTSELKPECLTCSDVLSCLNICCRKGIIIDGRSETLCLCAGSNN